jgi:hypothetical protein
MYIIYNYKSRSTNSFLFPPSCKVKSIKCPLSYFPTFLLSCFSLRFVWQSRKKFVYLRRKS